MGVTHGINSRAALTAHGEIAYLSFDDRQTNGIAFETGWTLHRRREMRDVTPFDNWCRVFAPRAEEWVARIEGYVDVAGYPGAFNYNHATVRLYTLYATDYYQGSAMIGEIGTTTEVDDSPRLYVVVFGITPLDYINS